MRTILWLAVLFACAVAAALFAQGNQGQVALLWPPWQVDISANLAIALLLLAFVLMHVLLRSTAAILHMPSMARRWRARRKERAMHQQLLQAALHFCGGRFVRARKAALEALESQQALERLRGHGLPASHMQQLACMARLLAAEATHELHEDGPGAQAHWDELMRSLDACPPALAGEVRHAAHLRAAHWALQGHDAARARHHLGQLPAGVARRTHALRLRLKAESLAHDHGSALASARLLAKHKALSSAAAASLMQTLVRESLHEARDAAQLQNLWQSLDARQRASADIALAATARLLALTQEAPAERAARARTWLLGAWEGLLQTMEKPGAGSADEDGAQRATTHLIGLVQLLEQSLEGLDSVWLARMEAAARRHPAQPCLQYLAGMACVQRQLWGKARQLLRQCVDDLPPALRGRAWQQLAHMAEHAQDAPAALHAWRQAALAYGRCDGGT